MSNKPRTNNRIYNLSVHKIVHLEKIVYSEVNRSVSLNHQASVLALV